jgi:SAM-dependent methyltransferase
VLVDEAFRRTVESGFYDRFYAHISDEFLAWRARGAVSKSRNIEVLAEGLRPNTVLEVGAGTCSILARLAEVGFARKFYALETSPSAVEYIRSKVRLPGLAGIYLADSTRTGLSDDSFDLGILSHVLEHVRDPRAILRETMRICRFVVLEVPLEDSLIGALEWRVRERIRGPPRSDNVSGHIQFFNLRRARVLIEQSGGRRIRERAYRANDEPDVDGRTGFLRFRTVIRHNLSRLVVAALGPRVVLTNYGALVRKAS